MVDAKYLLATLSIIFVFATKFDVIPIILTNIH